MHRPTILMAEPDPGQALSVRKLDVQTAKFNVLTAHSTREAVEIFQMFPNVSAVVLVPGEQVDVESVARTIKEAKSKVPVIAVEVDRSGAADHNIASRASAARRKDAKRDSQVMKLYLVLQTKVCPVADAQQKAWQGGSPQGD